MPVTRRVFLGLVASTAGCCAVGGIGLATRGDGSLLRPPGGQDAVSFDAACIRCDRCRSICPQGAIDVAHVEDGFLNARTPSIDFHKGYCDFCDKCIEACPTDALAPFDPAQDRIGTAIVQKDRCVAYFQGCTECYEKCPYGAISLDDSNHPVVDASICNGCGVCENECPALVYRSFSGGTRRGIVVVSPAVYERLGTTLVEDGEEVGL